MQRLVQALSMLVALILGIISAGALWTTADSQPGWSIVVQRRDGNLMLVDEQGRTKALTSDADGRTLIYRFPTPAPDGSSIATIALRHNAADVSSSLQVHPLDGQPSTLYARENSHPFYLSWSPDSRKIAFLADDPAGMTLRGVQIDARTDATLIAPGSPSYFAWSPDSRRLLLHIGGGAPSGSLQLYDWGADRPRPLSAMPARFQTPIWLPDGKQALAVVRQSSGSALATLDAQGGITRQIASVNDTTVFVATPDASHVAYLAFGGDQPGELHVLRLSDGNDRIIGSNVVTCFWSPDGRALAFLTLPQQGEAQTIALSRQQPGLRMRWNVLRLGDGALSSFDLFEPSREFLELLPFFDQYAQSIRLWDRSGSRLLFATSNGVYTLDVATGENHLVGDGLLGVWLDSAKERQ
jgi:TolB protein